MWPTSTTMSVHAHVMAVSVLFAAVSPATSAIDNEIGALLAPLEADDACASSDDGECGVSLRQLRGLRLQGTGDVVAAAEKRSGALLSSLRNASAARADDSHEEVAADSQEESVANVSRVGSPCLCLFDIDRTLTGRQGSAGPGRSCSHNRVVPGVWDTAFYYGPLTLSELSVAGIESTFCGACYLGTISAGTASGHGEQHYLMTHVMKSAPLRSLASHHPGIMAWSYANHIKSPFVLAQPDRTKQHAVPHILNVYKAYGIDIALGNVYFFGDRGENIPFFKSSGINAKQISCASRDYHRGNMVGYCGATPAEIVPTPGISTCR